MEVLRLKNSQAPTFVQGVGSSFAEIILMKRDKQFYEVEPKEWSVGARI